MNDDKQKQSATPAVGGEPVAWRYKCQDGSEVLMLKRLTDEQKRRGYYTGEDGEEEVDGDEAIIGPFHWEEETPLYAAPPDSPLRKISPKALAALNHYRQADEDGGMVIVSRQALDEAIAIVSEQPAAENK